MIRKLGILASIIQVMMIPVLIEMNDPKNLVFPRPIFNEMKIDKEEIEWKSIKEIKGSRKESANGSVWVYIFYDNKNNVIQKIYGSDVWNTSVLHDYENDGIDEFFVRQHDVFTGDGGPIIAAYKFNNKRFKFWKKFNRSELPAYLEIKFFSASYWTIIYIIEFICVFTIFIWLSSIMLSSRPRVRD